MPKSRGCICDVVFAGVKRSGETVGHVPFNLAPIISAFLKRSCNKGLVEVTGNRVNRGAGYGLEIPCEYNFYGLYPIQGRRKHFTFGQADFSAQGESVEMHANHVARDIWAELNIH